MILGFAVTRHCNLRCAHCIRDDVTDVVAIEPDLVADVTDQALVLFDDLVVSLTGGEPLIHPALDELVDGFARRRVPWRFTTNGWHMARAMPVLDAYPPAAVRLSLSGGDEEVHDLERGRGSFRRLLTAVALCTSRRIPVHLSLVVDGRTRHQLRTAADLTEGLGCLSLSYILPQPVPGSASRGSDLPPGDWYAVRDEVRALARETGRQTRLGLDYGHPFDGPEKTCQTFAFDRIYVDPEGRLCACCQLSEYGFNQEEVVADLAVTSLAAALPRYRGALERLWAESRPGQMEDTPYEVFPCLRCAAACGKMEWLKGFPDSPWHPEAAAGVATGPWNETFPTA